MASELKKSYDAIIIGSGPGGSSLAYKLSKLGLRTLVVEQGKQLKPDPNDQSGSIGKYLYDVVTKDEPISFVGGASKFYGSALYRMRKSDFDAVEHENGISPAWPISYSDIEPYYSEAEMVYRVHGSAAGDPTDPRREPFPYPPVNHSPPIDTLVKRLESNGTKVASIPLGLDFGPGGKCVLCSTCDAYYCKIDAKMDAETAALRPALATGNVQLLTETKCVRVITDLPGKKIQGVLLRNKEGEEITVHSDIVAVCAGLPGSALLLRRSRTDVHPDGLGNAGGALGRYLGGHSTGLIFPFMGWRQIPAVYTKTFAINEFYDAAPDWQYPVGAIQAAGQMPFWEKAPPALRPLARAAGKRFLMTFYMTEALPTPDSGIHFDGDNIKSRTAPVHNIKSFSKLRRLTLDLFRRAGYPALAPRRSPYVWHEVGTVRFGSDPSTSVVDPDCQVHGIKGLYVVDISVLPTAGAVNTGLTIIALALRAGNRIAESLKGR